MDLEQKNRSQVDAVCELYRDKQIQFATQVSDCERIVHVCPWCSLPPSLQ